MSIRARLHHLLNGIVLLSFLFVPLQPLTQPSWTSSDQAQAAPAAGQQRPPALESPIAPSASERAPALPLFRTRVTVRNPSDWARLEKLGVVVLEGRSAEERATDQQKNTDRGTAQSVFFRSSVAILVDDDQLEALAHLRFEPQSTDELGTLVMAHAQAKPWLAAGLQPLLAKAAALQAAVQRSKGAEVQRSRGAEESVSPEIAAARTDLRAAMRALTTEQQADLVTLTSVDADADGLTNTQEVWWCTDSLNADSDGDGTNDGDEVQVAKDWLGNRRSGPPASGKPFVGWPSAILGCPDDDNDDVPDLAERWELGLNMNNPSTDRDRYSDGMELFGLDSTGPMSPIVRPPGNHPFVAAYPVIHVDAVPGSFRVETVTELHLDQTVITGTAKTYGTAETRGTSDSVSDTVTWNQWQEVSTTTPGAIARGESLQPTEFIPPPAIPFCVANPLICAAAVATVKLVIDCGGQALFKQEECWEWVAVKKAGGAVYQTSKSLIGELMSEPLQGTRDDFNLNGLQLDIGQEHCVQTPQGLTCKPKGEVLGAPAQQQVQNQIPTENMQDINPGNHRLDFFSDNKTTVSVRPVYQASFPSMTPPWPSTTVTSGRSWGGAHTTTHTEYQEHTISQSEQFSTQTGWTSGTAKNTAHTADLTFSYRIENVGTDYARSLSNMIFNVYIGRDPNPAFTCQMNNPPPDRNCNLVSLDNVFPGDTHEYTTGRIWLSFEQMKALDLGGPIYVVVDSYSLGADDVFFQNARQGGMTVVMDDGVADGDESLDIYVLPTWEGDTILDVLARYFPTRKDADGNLLAISTPEWTTPPTWIERPLTDASWFNLYLDNLGDGSTPFRDTPAWPNSTMLMRYQTDSDRDGYSDRSELRLGTDPNDPASHPSPGLVAGLNTTRQGDEVTGRLAFLNTGNYDAYGVEAIMYAPDHTVSIGNNTIGGSGRVKAASQVVLGSRVLPPSLTNWRNSSARPYSVGSYTGNTDKVFTFTADSTGAVGSTQPITLTWDSGSITGTLQIPAGYQSPLPLDVTAGVQVGFYSGSIIATDSFTVGVQLPRDTFTYTVQSEPYTTPGVVVSYNDPQGNHRFISSVELADLSTDLAPYAGQMLAPLSLEIATTAPFTSTGTNTTNYIFNLPDPRPIEDGHLFVEYVKDDGTVVAEQVFTQTLQPGPNIIPVIWDTGIFTETYQTDHDYNILALVTDWQGNIIQSLARPLSSFQEDPKPVFAMADADTTWGSGTVTQGEVLSHTITLANTGFLDLYTYLSSPTDTITSTGTPTLTSTPTTNPMPTDTTTPTVDGPTEMFGDGRDGDLTVTDTIDLNPVRASASGMAGSNVLAISGVTGGGFQAEQLVLIHQTRGTGAGKWEFNYVQSVSTGQLTLRTPLKNTYTTDSGISRAQVLRVPQYHDVNINTGATVAPASWDGHAGGILAFLASGTTTVNGRISVKGRGFAGGVGGTLSRTPGHGTSGEGENGIGAVTTVANGMGGGGGGNGTSEAGKGAGGGGGGFVTAGTAGGSSFNLTPGAGGAMAANVVSTTLLFGGGGGGGGQHNGNNGQSGGTGGGIALVVSRATVLNDSIVGFRVDLTGNPGGATANVGGSGGGGAGGAGLIRAGTVTLGTSRVNAQGGAGGSGGGGTGHDGGAGGNGRIRVEYCDTISGSTNPPASMQQITCSTIVTSTPPPLTLAGTASRQVPPGDTTTYTVILDTSALPAGPYDETLTLRTSDPANPTRTVRITGTIQPLTDTALSRRVAYRPWGQTVYVPGSHPVGEVITFTYTISPDQDSTYPLFVYDQSREHRFDSGGFNDLNHDGFPDIVFGSGRIYWGSEAGFNASTQYQTLPRRNGSGVHVADLNNDSYQDIVFLTADDQSPYDASLIYWGSSAGYSTNNRSDLPTRNAYAATSADLNKDGYIDLVVTNRVSPSYVYWGSAVGYSASNRTTLESLDGTGVAVSDFNADRYLDIVIANMAGEPYIYWGGANGYSSANRSTVHVQGGRASDWVSVTDLDEDGYKDLVFSLATNSEWCAAIRYGTASGYDSGRWVALYGLFSGQNFVFDFNRDGYLDVLFLNTMAPDYIYWGSASEFSNSNRSEWQFDRNSWHGYVTDLNNDGYLDFVTGWGGRIYWGGSDVFNTSRRLILPGGDQIGDVQVTVAGDPALSRPPIVEKVAGTDNVVRFVLPETITTTQRYIVQFGDKAEFASGGSITRHVALPKRRYAAATMDVLLKRAGQSDVQLALDIGANGSTEWSHIHTFTGTVEIPVPDFRVALNAYMDSATPDANGIVVVPISVSLNTSGELFLTNFVVAPASNVDLIVDDIGFGAPSANVELLNLQPATVTPTEGDVITVTATLTNAGGADSGPLTVAFFATPPAGLGETYIGAAFVPDVPAGGTAQASIQWNTLGFTGNVPVRVVADPFDRVAETNEGNNAASATLHVRTRPDLYIRFADPFRMPIRVPDLVFIGITSTLGISSPTGIASQTEVVVGEAYTITLLVGNAGETEAGAQMVALYDGNPDAGGTLIGEKRLDPLPVTSDGIIIEPSWVGFSWTPDTLGPHRLFARVDRDDEVDEFNEGNNETWRDFYVGFRGSIVLDSGNLSNDPAYTADLGYGYVYQYPFGILGNCGTEPEETYRLDPAGSVVYRFDHLSPGRFYHLDLTLYECGQGAGRQESVYVDGGNLVAGPEDLGDGEVHRLSILLDPALYTDRTITVTIEAHEGLGSLVNEIALRDVDYRYADSGDWRDPEYSRYYLASTRHLARIPWLEVSQNYGWLDGSATGDWGNLPYQTARVDQLDNDVRYKFDDLDPLKRYQVYLSFYQGTGNNRVQQVRIDEQPIGKGITIVNSQRYSTTLSVPLTAYQDDRSIVVSVVRTNASVGAMVNEIALEEKTQIDTATCQVTETPHWTAAYGSVTIAGQPAPPGTVVTAETPRGDVVGCFIVKQETPGLYGFMTIYGEDASANPPIPGMRDGETILFRVNGALAVPSTPLAWQDDKTSHQVNLEAGNIQAQSILLKPGWNLFSFHLEPPVPQVDTVLHAITGKYCQVLGETGIYDCTVPERFRSLKELHGGQGYYLRLEGGASANLLIEGVSVSATTPISLHAGWNWVSYLPRINQPVADALQSIEGHYLMVTDGSLIYDPALPQFSTLTDMEPGRGYLIYATGPVSLTYPSGIATTADLTSATPLALAGVCPEVARTPYFTSLYGSLHLNGLPAPVGTRVEVVTPRGEVAGCFTVNQEGQYGFLPVYGEDEGDPPIPGFREGEPLALQINGWSVTPLATPTWADDKLPHRMDLAITVPYRFYLPLLRQ